MNKKDLTQGGFEVIQTQAESDGTCYLEVYRTNELRKRIELWVSVFYYPENETPEEAVAKCLEELQDPCTCFDDKEEEEKSVIAINWLADFYEITKN